MTEYWKSQGKKWCEYCRNWMQNNPAAIRMHENAAHHKQMVQEFLADKSRKRKNEEQEKNEVDKELKAAMQAADKQYALDIVAGHATGAAPQLKGQVVRDAAYEANLEYIQAKNAASLQNFYERNAAKIEEMKTKYLLEKQLEEEEAQAAMREYMELRGIKLPEEKEEAGTDNKPEEEEEEEEDEEEDKKKTKKKKKEDNIIIPPPVAHAPDEAPMPGAWQVVEPKSDESDKRKQKHVITVVLGEEGIDRVEDPAGIFKDQEEEEEAKEEGDGNESDELRAEVDAEVKVEEEEEEPAKPVVFAKRTPFKGNTRARSKAPAGGDDD